MDLLSREELADTIAWLPHGHSFVIYDKQKFVKVILPTFFRESKFTSFTRKLNRWGFERICKGVETGGYTHKYFLRDHPELCKKMRCQKKNERKEPNTSTCIDISAKAAVSYSKKASLPKCLDRKVTKEKETQENALPVEQPKTTVKPKSVNTGPSIDTLTRNQLHLLHLKQLKQEQDGINTRLNELTQLASALPRTCNLDHTHLNISSMFYVQDQNRQKHICTQ